MANNEETIEKLSTEEVLNVINMAAQIYSNLGNFYGYTTPSILNNNLNNLNNNALIPTKESLEKALSDYKNNGELLQAYNEFAEVYDMLFNRTLNYYVGLLSFDLDYVCTNIKDNKEYKSEEYLQDKRRVEKFLDNFKYKDEFVKVLKNIIRNEIYYTWFRDSEGNISKTGDIDLDDNGKKKLSKYTLQVMPQQYCMLTGYWESGLLYDFNMAYFLKAGVSLNEFDPIFKQYFKDTFKDGMESTYNPTANFDRRSGNFANWHQTSPEKGAWAFKFDTSNFNTTPFLSPLLKNVLLDSEVAKLQSDSNIAAARGILYGEIPLLDKQKSGQVKDAMAWSATTFTKFMQLVKAGLNASINAVAMPAENVKFAQYVNNNKTLVEDQNKITAGTGVGASRVIYSSDKVSESELQAQIVGDYNIVKRVYSQFENFMDYFVNKKTRKYRFKFHFDGCTYPFMKESKKKALMDLADVGIVLNPSAYACIVDMSPTQFERSLREGHYGDLSEMLTPLISIHTQSTQGAPKKDSTEISEGGSIARDYD